MKTLLVLRHAKSSWNNPALSDHERPLNDRGIDAAPKMAQLIVEKGIVPDLVLCSTAQRAFETMELISRVDGFNAPIQHVDELYLAPPKTYYSALKSLAGDAEKVMIVGHNPGLEDLVEDLTGEPVTMPTAALACIEITSFDALPERPASRLLGHWVPRELG